ncbi:MAG: hypothetical protein Q7J80_05970 [Anaerolineales bacterium]|nr:hypothetical protein [Anaerolineales bacterium]
MAKHTPLQLWDLWYPQAGATGLSFARGRLEATNILIVHAPPPSLTVEIRSDKGRRLAFSQDLPQTADRPMAILTRRGNRVTRQDRWPTKVDIGELVLLPGGEVGVLVQWWNAEDGSEWRWQIEFYNHR